MINDYISVKTSNTHLYEEIKINKTELDVTFSWASTLFEIGIY